MYWPEIFCLKAVALSAHMYVLAFQDQHTHRKWNIPSDQISSIAFSFARTSRERIYLFIYLQTMGNGRRGLIGSVDVTTMYKPEREPVRTPFQHPGLNVNHTIQRWRLNRSQESVPEQAGWKVETKHTQKRCSHKHHSQCKEKGIRLSVVNPDLVWGMRSRQQCFSLYFFPNKNYDDSNALQFFSVFYYVCQLRRLGIQNTWCHFSRSCLLISSLSQKHLFVIYCVT